MDSLKSKLFVPICEEGNNGENNSKITIVGVGQVGMAAAFSVMLQNVCTEIALVDIMADKLEGEMMDLQHGQQFLKKCKIVASTDYAISSDSNIVVITAGARQKEGESRLNLVQRNVDIFKKMIPQIVKYSPNCIIVIVSNPVDILAYVAWKISGFPRNRVIGTGTMLDSARFRFLLGEKLGVSASSCHGYIIGEHGDSSVALWSAVNVGGINLTDINPDIGTDKDTEKYYEIHKQVIESAYKIIKLKGYTSWAIGVSVSTLCSILLHNQHNILPLSVLAKDVVGINEEIYISLPCVVCRDGVTHIVPQRLNAEEKKKMNLSINELKKIIFGIKW